MALSKTEKTLVGGLIVVALGAVAYYIFSGSSAPAPTATDSTVAQPAVGQNILALVQKLKVITIDPSIFASPLFASLKDSETPLAPEIQGRADPFSVIGVDAPFNTTVTVPQNSTQNSTSGRTQAEAGPSIQAGPQPSATSTSAFGM